MEILAEEIKFIKKLADSTSFELDLQIYNELGKINHARIEKILCAYFKENTTKAKVGLVEQFENFGITKNDGKLVIAKARRLGFQIF